MAGVIRRLPHKECPQRRRLNPDLTRRADLQGQRLAGASADQGSYLHFADDEDPVSDCMLRNSISTSWVLSSNWPNQLFSMPLHITPPLTISLLVLQATGTLVTSVVDDSVPYPNPYRRMRDIVTSDTRSPIFSSSPDFIRVGEKFGLAPLGGVDMTTVHRGFEEEDRPPLTPHSSTPNQNGARSNRRG
jgi:hypothetical protein